MSDFREPINETSGRAPASTTVSGSYLTELEQATRGLFAANISVLDRSGKHIGLTSLRALQALDCRGPSMVAELAADLHLLPSTASRLSDRLADAGLITRCVSPTNRRATQLELSDAGRAVLDELTRLRIEVFAEVVARMTERDRTALLRGTAAFTRAHRALTAPTASSAGSH